MTNVIAYHPKTTELALFETDGQYWIGSYFPHATHQNGEPPYVLLNGYSVWSDKQTGMDRLFELTGEEF